MNKRLMKRNRGLLAILSLSSVVYFYNGCSGFRALNDGSSSSLSGDSTLRRLTNLELNNSLAIALEDSGARAETFLPADETSPFDNETALQNPSAPFVQGLETFASDVAQRLVADSARKMRVASCSTNDSTCWKSVAGKLGRLFFRRTLTAAEISSLATFAAMQASAGGTFDSGLEMLVRVLIQHPEFIYRLENPSVLSDTQIASRLSFLIWGSGPDDALIALAESGNLRTKQQVTQAATQMLSSPRALKQMQRFHGFWLAYGKLPSTDPLSAAMKQEADAMVQSVLYDTTQPWREILNTRQTKINNILGNVYGIAGLSDQSTVVQFPADRQGILSTAAFLSAAPKFGDTSPTQRGKFIRERLFCQVIPPPPVNVNADNPPPIPAGEPDCKYNRYDAHRKAGSTCFACHQQMDPIGFGLERFDRFGRYRQYDYNADGSSKMTCAIEGKGEIPSVGTFSGPGELANLLIQSNIIENCLVKQFYHFGMGETATDLRAVVKIESDFKGRGGKFSDLVMALVSSDAFLQK